MTKPKQSIFSRDIVFAAIGDSFLKLDPRTLFRNPVIFIVEIGSVVTTAIFFRDLVTSDDSEPLWFTGTVALWLWLTVLFANFAEAIAEGRGKAQANALRATRTTTMAFRRSDTGGLEEIPAPELSAATSSSSRRARSSPRTARSSKASARSTSPRSPASRRRSSARLAAIARQSPEAHVCSPTAS